MLWKRRKIKARAISGKIIMTRMAPVKNSPDPMNGSLFSLSPEEDNREKASKKGHFADDENERDDASHSG